MEPFDSAMAILRVGVGAVFLAHGIKHLGSRDKTTAWFESIGFRAPGLQWMAMTATEIGAGVLLVIGLLTGLAAAAVAASMFVAFVTVHRAAGFWITAFMQDGVEVEGYEYVATLMVAATAIAVGGAGSFSLDDSIGLAADLDGWVGAALIAGGLVLAVGQLATFWRPPRS